MISLNDIFSKYLLFLLQEIINHKLTALGASGTSCKPSKLIAEARAAGGIFIINNPHCNIVKKRKRKEKLHS